MRLREGWGLGAAVEVREEGPLLVPPTCPPSEGTQGQPGVHGLCIIHVDYY